MTGYRLVVYSDIDGTISDLETYTVNRDTHRASEALRVLRVPVVLVTSKTLEESLVYYRKARLWGPLGSPVVAFELSAGIAAPPGVLAYYDYVDSATGMAVIELARPLDRLAGEVHEAIPRHCRERVVSLREASPELVSSITGLPPDEAELARRRRYDEALWGPRECLEETAARALAMGLNARLGARVLHISTARGKSLALRILGDLIPHLRGSVSVAMGDSMADADMLEEADVAVVIPHRSGAWLRLRRSDYVVAPQPAPEGWAWAVWNIVLGLA